MRDPWAPRDRLPLYVGAGLAALLSVAVVSAATGPDDQPVPASAVEEVQPTPTPTPTPTPSQTPTQPPADPITDAAVAGVTAWAAPDEDTRQEALTTTATDDFTDAMEDVDPAQIGPCTPTDAEHTAPGIGGAARVLVECGEGHDLHVDLVTDNDRWLVTSILPA